MPQYPLCPPEVSVTTVPGLLSWLLKSLLCVPLDWMQWMQEKGCELQQALFAQRKLMKAYSQQQRWQDGFKVRLLVFGRLKFHPKLQTSYPEDNLCPVGLVLLGDVAVMFIIIIITEISPGFSSVWISTFYGLHTYTSRKITAYFTP